MCVCVCVCCLCGSVSPLDGLSYWVCKSAADMRGVTRSCGQCLRDDSETKAPLMRMTWHIAMTTRGTEPHKQMSLAQRQQIYIYIYIYEVALYVTLDIYQDSEILQYLLLFLSSILLSLSLYVFFSFCCSVTGQKRMIHDV